MCYFYHTYYILCCSSVTELRRNRPNLTYEVTYTSPIRYFENPTQEK